METKPPSGAGAPAGEAPAEAGFVRGLGLFDATMLVAGSMIGSGIFIVSAGIARSVGSPFWLLVIWTVSGAMTVIGALSYGELAAMIPRAGGQYVFLREAYGPLAGFLYGWTFFLVIQTGTIAAVAVAFGKFLGLDGYRALALPLPEGWPFEKVTGAQVVAVALIALLTAVNLRGIRTGKTVQDLFTAAKVLSLVAVIALGVYAAVSLPATGNLGAKFFGPPREGASGAAFLVVLGAAMYGALFSSDAWNNVTFTAGEVRDPRRNVPLSLAFGTGLVTVLYLGANLAYLAVLDFGSIAAAPHDRVATAMLRALFGPPGETAMAAAILVSTFGCNNGLILAGARVTYAMARDRLFFRATGELNAAGVPGKALLGQGVVAAVLALSGKYLQLINFVIFATLLFYIATVLAIFVLRRKRPDAPRPYRAFGYPVLPGLYIALAAGVAAALVASPDTRGSSLVGLGIVAAGLPVYFFLPRLPASRTAASRESPAAFGDRPT